MCALDVDDVGAAGSPRRGNLWDRPGCILLLLKYGADMPFQEVMHKLKHGALHSGSKTGQKVTSRKQAIAIMMSEKRAAQGGKKEYQPASLRGLRKAAR